MKISAVIITFNEERNLARCLSSVEGIADEIVVVDSYSTDKTREIAESFGARFLEHPFEGHIQQKNWAKDQAKYHWVLSLDADEALSDKLSQSIKELKGVDPQVDGFVLNRLTNYAGKWVRHSGWYPDRKLRLWKKDSGHWGGTNPHDKFILDPGKTSSRLDGDILHYSIDSVEHHLQIIEKFTDIASKALYEKGKGHRAWKRFISPIVKFVGSYFFRGGFLDGKVGWLVCYHSARATYLKYYKLHLLVKAHGKDA